MRAMMMGAVAAVGLGSAVEAATTTFHGEVMVDELVGSFDGSEELGVVSEVNISFDGTLPSEQWLDTGNYVLPGTMALDFGGERIDFAGTIVGYLFPTFYPLFDDEECCAFINYLTAFNGLAADGTTVDFYYSGFVTNNTSSSYLTADIDRSTVESLQAGIEQGNFVFETGTAGNSAIRLEVFGPGLTFSAFASEDPYDRHDPYRVEVATVPVPASAALLLAALTGLGALVGRHRADASIRRGAAVSDA